MRRMHMPAGYASALRHGDLRRLLAALTISATASWAYSVALLVFVFEETGSLTWVGAASLARFVPALLFSPFAGLLADRFERVRVMVTSDLLCVGFQVGLVLTAALGGPVLLALLFSAGTAIANEVYFPASQAMIPDLASEEDLAAANALKGTSENLVVIVGPAIGAAILTFGSAEIVFAINAASFAAAALIVRRISTRNAVGDVTDGDETGVLRQVAVGFTAIRDSRPARVLVALSVLVSFVYGTDTVLLVAVSDQKLGTGAEGFGYLLTGLGVGGLLAAAAIPRISRSPKLGWIIAGSAALFCLPTVLLIWIEEPSLAFAVQVFRGVATLVVDVLAMTVLQRAVESHVLARVFGIFFAFVLGAIALGSVVAPVLTSVLGLDGTLAAMGVAPALLAFLALPALLRIDRETAGRLALLEPRIAVLEGLEIFAAAGRAPLEQVASVLEEMEFTAGTAIVRQGEPADALYVLTEGEVEVLVGADRHVRDMQAPSYFGEIGVLARIPRTASVIARSHCRVYRLDGDAFVEALTVAPPTASLGATVRTRLARTHPGTDAAIERDGG